MLHLKKKKHHPDVWDKVSLDVKSAFGSRDVLHEPDVSSQANLAVWVPLLAPFFFFFSLEKAIIMKELVFTSLKLCRGHPPGKATVGVLRSALASLQKPTPIPGKFLFLLIVKRSETHVCRTLCSLPAVPDVTGDILHAGQGHWQQSCWLFCQWVPSLVLKQLSLVIWRRS